MTLERGQPFKLEPFQRVILSEFFAGTREVLVMLPKKNGKSTLLGALALYHLCTTPDAECVLAAASRDQAQIMLRQAQGFIRRSEGLQLRLQVKQREIVHRRFGGRVRILASDVDTADGVIPTLALVDELHRHKTSDLYGVFRDGLGPRDGQLVTISTAGVDQGSALSQIREKALEMGAKREGAYLHAASKGFVLHEWSLRPDQDLDDLKLVKQANPLSVMTIEKLRERHDSPSMTPWQWARFGCNVWTASEESWLPYESWDDCREDGALIPEGAEVILGVDVATKHDTSAVGRLWKRPDGKVVVEAEVFKPRGDGTAMDLGLIERAVRDNADRFQVRCVVYDRWSFERSAQVLGDEGLLMVEHPMSAERMSISSQNFYDAVVSKRIVHGGDPVLAAHVHAGAVKPTERGWRLVKNKAKRPIDALITLVLGFSQVDQRAQSPFVEVIR